MISEEKSRLYQSIVAFLKSECNCNEYSSDIIESLEVAKQCIESAFGVSGDIVPDLDLLSLVKKSTPFSTKKVDQVNPLEKAKAENFKTQGNAFMVSGKFNDAIECYNNAIALDPNNAIYYCNRAAAKSRVNRDDESIKDCEKALEIDPTYSKAYGRMGIAYSNMGNHEKAIEFYKKAIALDPDNSNFKQNLALAEENLKRSSSQPSTTSSGVFGGLDLNTLLSNPVMQNMAQRLVSDPQMQSTVSSMMQNIFGGGAAPTEGNGTTSEAPNMDDLLRYGQQFAQQMQQTNPDLVDSLRQQMQNMASQQNPSTDRSKTNGDNDHNS